MIEELIYTSAPRGLRPGSSGYCTVASSRGMSAPVAQFLESISGYRHLFEPGTPEAVRNPVVHYFLRARVGGQDCHILSRLADAGLDYSGRSNKLAHHLIMPPVRSHPAGPAWLMRHTSLLTDRWSGDPRHLAPRNLPAGQQNPEACRTWQAIAGDAGWAAILVAAVQRRQIVNVVVPPGANVLQMVVEAQSVLPPELRWQATFATWFTRFPAGVECLWRFLPEGAPEIAATRRARDQLFLDLSNPSGSLDESAAQAARAGALFLGAAPAVPRPFADSLPANPADFHSGLTGEVAPAAGARPVGSPSPEDYRLTPPPPGPPPRGFGSLPPAAWDADVPDDGSPWRLAAIIGSLATLFLLLAGSGVWLWLESRQQVEAVPDVPIAKVPREAAVEVPEVPVPTPSVTPETEAPIRGGPTNAATETQTTPDESSGAPSITPDQPSGEPAKAFEISCDPAPNPWMNIVERVLVFAPDDDHKLKGLTIAGDFLQGQFELIACCPSSEKYVLSVTALSKLNHWYISFKPGPDGNSNLKEVRVATFWINTTDASVEIEAVPFSHDAGDYAVRDLTQNDLHQKLLQHSFLLLRAIKSASGRTPGQPDVVRIDLRSPISGDTTLRELVAPNKTVPLLPLLPGEKYRLSLKLVEVDDKTKTIWTDNITITIPSDAKPVSQTLEIRFADLFEFLRKGSHTMNLSIEISGPPEQNKHNISWNLTLSQADTESAIINDLQTEFNKLKTRAGELTQLPSIARKRAAREGNGSPSGKPAPKPPASQSRKEEHDSFSPSDIDKISRKIGDSCRAIISGWGTELEALVASLESDAESENLATIRSLRSDVNRFKSKALKQLEESIDKFKSRLKGLRLEIVAEWQDDSAGSSPRSSLPLPFGRHK